MKNQNIFLLTFLFVALVSAGCFKDSCERRLTYLQANPVQVNMNELREQGIVNKTPLELKDPGKLYFYEDYIFINEKRKGIHIIDNKDATNPTIINFVEVPGNVDMAIRGTTLYADSYTDLLSIDITNPSQVQLRNRVEDVFPHYGEFGNGSIIAYYEYEEITEELSCDDIEQVRQNGGIFVDFADDVRLETATDGAIAGAESNSTGVGGSLARFTISKDFLYTVDNSNLKVFDLSVPDRPDFVNDFYVGWQIETIFPYRSNLFIASNTGMFIYSINRPSEPEYVSQFSHLTACDPVYVSGDYAYVTLRSGRLCNGSELNQLDVLNIKDIYNPVLEESFPMDNPHGLSVSDNTLFLCEGDFGLKVFDVTDPLTLDEHLIDHEKNLHAYDVISLPNKDNTLLMIGEDGFYQYNYTDPSDLNLLSHLPVAN